MARLPGNVDCVAAQRVYAVIAGLAVRMYSMFMQTRGWRRG